MKFLDIFIQNFLAISLAEVSLGDRGLVLVQGENEDDPSASSNGAGKSSIADAICWVLYGQTARGESGDAIVNNVAGKDCKVDIEIQDGDSMWKIIRHRKHKSGKNGLTVWEYPPAPAAPVDHTKGTEKLTQEVIERLIGCSYEVFRAAIYAGQEAMPDLPAMTDKQLKVLIEEAAGTTVLERAHKIAREEFAEAKEHFNGFALQIGTLEAQAREQTELHNTTLKAVTDFEADRITEILRVKEQIKELDRLIDDKVRDYEPDASLVAEKDKIHRALADIKSERAAESGFIAARDKIAAEVTRRRTLLGAVQTEVKEAKSDFDGVGERVGTPCATCGKTYCEEDLEDARALAKKKLTDKVEKFKSLRAETEQMIEDLHRAEQLLTDFQDTMTDVSSMSARLAEINSLLSKELEQLNEIKAFKVSRSNLEERLGTLAAATHPGKKTLTIIEDAIAKTEQKIKDAHLEREKAAAQVGRYEKIVGVFSTSGVRAHILDTVTPFLNDRTANYLGSLSDGNIAANWTTLTRTARGELREKFTIEVTNDKGGNSFGLLSGGEKRKVRIATALALQDLVASRATKSVELFIGDEIDDGLDEPGLERLMGILEEKARERGSVFVISHRSLKDWCSNVITVKKSGGTSSLIEGE